MQTIRRRRHLLKITERRINSARRRRRRRRRIVDLVSFIVLAREAVASRQYEGRGTEREADRSTQGYKRKDLDELI